MGAEWASREIDCIFVQTEAQLVTRNLPILEVEIPCDESWDAMSGDDQTRRCGVCRHDVHDIASFTNEELTVLLARNERLCIRLFRRADGTAVTADCAPLRFRLERAVQRSALGRSKWIVAVMFALIALMSFGWMRFGQAVTSRVESSTTGIRSM